MLDKKHLFFWLVRKANSKSFSGFGSIITGGIRGQKKLSYVKLLLDSFIDSQRQGTKC